MVASEREVVAQIISGAPFPSKRSYAKADAVLSALSALSDRSRSEVGGDVVEAAARERLKDFCDGVDAWPSMPQKNRDMHIRSMAVGAGIIAADAERRVRKRIRRLEDALRPFAIAGMVRGNKGDDDLTLNFIEDGKTEPLIAIRWPDFTRAADAIEEDGADHA